MYSAYPWHQLRIVFDLQLIVVISTSQSTKHRVTLFHYVVPDRESSLHDRSIRRALRLQKYEKELEQPKKNEKNSILSFCPSDSTLSNNRNFAFWPPHLPYALEMPIYKGFAHGRSISETYKRGTKDLMLFTQKTQKAQNCAVESWGILRVFCRSWGETSSLFPLCLSGFRRIGGRCFD